jgi:uncharacterized membrane protein
MDMLDGETEVRDYNLERLMMLSDGVFAIAMTLLALDLRAPANWDHQLGSLVQALGPKLVAYTFSVFMIGIYWVRHRRTFGQIKRADLGLTIINLVILALVTLIPAAASLIWETGLAAKAKLASVMTGNTAGFAIYFWLLTAIGLASLTQWIYVALVADLLDRRISRKARLIDAARQFVAPAVPATLAVLVTGDDPDMSRNVLRAAPIWLLAAGLRIWARRAAQAEAHPRGRRAAGA